MKRFAPAAARNSAPIAEVLAGELPEIGLVLEVASGTGEHAVFMARRFPALDWQPSDVEPAALGSIDAWASEAGLENLRPAIALDTSAKKWPLDAANALVCINMVHISPWSATEGLFAGAGRLLGEVAPLVLYGPFLEGEVETASSNLAFDADLKHRDPRWGLRQVETLDALAAGEGFVRTARYAMPANNLMLVYRKQASTQKNACR